MNIRSMMSSSILNAHYEDVKSFNNLNDCNIRSGKYAKNCALQNIFKIFTDSCDGKNSGKIVRFFK